MNMSVTEYQELINKKNHKYNAKQTIVDGIKFSSQAEANYYCQLKLLKRSGEVKEIELQPKFEIIKPYTIGKRKVGATYYIADFRVTYVDGRQEIIDVKGRLTPVYKLKKKLFESQYGIEIIEVKEEAV